MRPLQLPTCLRRLHGATIADCLGSVIEPRLSPNRAAKRQGQCGPNITSATNHLALDPVADAEPGPSWAALLGAHQDAVDQYIQDAARHLGPAPSTAVLFCDQNKAFERISLQWMG
eukprot:9106425-Pyramimonas_sp.AAC.1